MKKNETRQVLAVELDAGLLHEAEEILNYLGLSSEDAIRLFYSQIVLKGGLPFKLRLPRHLRKTSASHPVPSGQTDPVFGEGANPDWDAQETGTVLAQDSLAAQRLSSGDLPAEDPDGQADAFMQSILDEVYDEIRRGEGGEDF